MSLCVCLLGRRCPTRNETNPPFLPARSQRNQWPNDAGNLGMLLCCILVGLTFKHCFLRCVCGAPSTRSTNPLYKNRPHSVRSSCGPSLPKNTLFPHPPPSSVTPPATTACPPPPLPRQQTRPTRAAATTAEKAAAAAAAAAAVTGAKAGAWRGGGRPTRGSPPQTPAPSCACSCRGRMGWRTAPRGAAPSPCGRG